MCAYAYATVLERGAAASIDIDAAVAAHHDEFAFPMYVTLYTSPSSQARLNPMDLVWRRGPHCLDMRAAADRTAG